MRASKSSAKHLTMVVRDDAISSLEHLNELNNPHFLTELLFDILSAMTLDISAVFFWLTACLALGARDAVRSLEYALVA